MAPLRIELLGGFGLRLASNADVTLPTRKSRLLLAYLALAPGRAQPRTKLMNLLWSDRAEPQARNSLRQELHALRHGLAGIDPPLLKVAEDTLSLDAGAVAIDAIEFERLASCDEEEALARAAKLYRGDLLEGVVAADPAFEEWLVLERRRFRDLAVAALGKLLALKTGQGAFDAAVMTGRQLLALDPLHEETHCALMRLLAGQGHRNAALRQYQLCRAALARELGVEPEEATERLHRELQLQAVKNIDEPVRAYALTSGGVPQAADREPAKPKPLPLPDKPSIAVLPFTNMSGDPEQEYFADGLVEEIITGLSRVRSFFVIARNSSFTYKGRAVDVRQVSRELGVRYVLEGSIRKAGSRVRIVGQLVDGTTGHHVWADRFDGDMSDIFELQDRVTESVVGVVEPSIRLEEIRQARTKPTSYITAYDLYLRALPGFYSMTCEGFADVRRLTNEALSIDPGFTLAKALGAYIRSLSVSQCWHEPDDIRVAIRMAREVIPEARDDPTSLRFAAQVLAYSAKDYEPALAAIERSLHLNPNSAQTYTGGGWVNAHAGRPLVAIDYFHRAMRLSPLDPEKGIALSGIGMSYLMLERHEEALEWGECALREMPGYGSSHRVVICALVRLGRLDEAKVAANRLMEAFPTYNLALQRQINPWRDLAFAERYLDGLRAAGVPEE